MLCSMACIYGAHRKRIRVTLGEHSLYYEDAEPLPKHPYYLFTPSATCYNVAVM